MKPRIAVKNLNVEQILVKLPADMKRELVAQAQARDRRLGPHVRDILRRHCEAQERRTK